MTHKTLTPDRVSLPPGFRMFILPEYRLVTPSYSVKLSRSHGTIVSALLANYERYVLRCDLEASLWGHLKDGGPEDGANAICVMLSQIKTKFRSVGIGISFKGNGWHRRDRAVRASGLEECKPVGCPNNSVRLRALWDRKSPNPSRGLPKQKPTPTPPPPPPLTQEPGQIPENVRYSYVERPRVKAAWTHNARAEVFFGQTGPK